MGTSADVLVAVIDDDGSVRKALRRLLRSAGLSVQAFASAEDYLQAGPAPACLILDVELPGISGLEFQKQAVRAEHPPIVFITGHGDIPSTVRAMKGGAVDFLTKPFADQDLLGAIQSAIAADKEAHRDRAELVGLHARLASLTPREREVLPLVVSGLLNKQAAQELGISETTLEIHRGKIMRKMAAASLADLVRIAAKLGVKVTHSRRTGTD